MKLVLYADKETLIQVDTSWPTVPVTVRLSLDAAKRLAEALDGLVQLIVVHDAPSSENPDWCAALRDALLAAAGKKEPPMRVLTEDECRVRNAPYPPEPSYTEEEG